MNNILNENKGMIYPSIRDLVDGYVDDNNDGVKGYGGKLDIRPAYQRQFVYAPAQRDKVIESIRKGRPISLMYWAKSGEDSFEVLDGQQRTISICQYVMGDYAINYQYFHNLTKEEQDQILDYQLFVCLCTGTDKEKLDWFKTINVVGEKLTEQELRNAVYTGPWLSDAKRYFSKTAGPAFNFRNTSKLLNGTPIRQDYLQTAISWITEGTIEDYMSKHQHDENAGDLWAHFQIVINWVNTTFPVYRKEMKGLDWGAYYDNYHSNTYNPTDLEKKVQTLMADDDVTKKSGIYEYVLSGCSVEKALSVRVFTESQKRSAFEKQKGICPICGNEFKLEDMEGDHIVPWSKGGKTVPENLQMICKNCNRIKSNT